jgi:lipoprotein-releasing system permease protein
MANRTRPRPFSAFEWMMALRYLRARRQERFISIISGFSLIGIALGVATLIIVMSVMNGFRSELLSRILGLTGHIYVQSRVGALPEYQAMAQRIRAVPGVTSAVPVLEGEAMLSTPKSAFAARVRGVRPQDLGAFPGVFASISPEARRGLAEGQSVILGSRLAEKLGLKPGDSVTLLAMGAGIADNAQVASYNVAGTFNVGVSQYDESFLYMPLAEAQEFFGIGDIVGRLEVTVTDPDRVGALRDPIIRASGGQRVLDWQMMNAGLFDQLHLQRVVLFLILALIILVAALNMISGLIMLVKDKSGNIAIMRTIGASKGSVMRVFFIAGASIGIVGTVAGVAIAMVFVDNIEAVRQFLQRLAGVELFNPEVYFLNEIPARLDMGDLLGVVGLALGLSFLATLFPAWRAARLDPVVALRSA